MFKVHVESDEYLVLLMLGWNPVDFEYTGNDLYVTLDCEREDYERARALGLVKPPWVIRDKKPKGNPY